MFQCLLAANQGSNERQKHFDCINFASFTILIIILIIAALLDLLVIIVASPPPSAQLVERRQDEQKGHFAQNEKTVDVCGGKYQKLRRPTSVGETPPLKPTENTLKRLLTIALDCNSFEKFNA